MGTIGMGELSFSYLLIDRVKDFQLLTPD